MYTTRTRQPIPAFSLMILALTLLGTILIIAEAAWPAVIAQPRALTAEEQFCADLNTLLSDRADIITQRQLLIEDLASRPDTPPDVIVAALYNLWTQTQHHAELLASIAPPAAYTPAMAAYGDWLGNLDQGIGLDWEYSEYRVWQSQNNGYPSQYTEGYEEHAQIAQFYYGRAETAWAECEDQLAMIGSPCR